MNSSTTEAYTLKDLESKVFNETKINKQVSDRKKSNSFFKPLGHQSFRATRHNNLLKKGVYKFSETLDEKPRLFLDSVRSNKSGQGFGTAVIREGVQLSRERKQELFLDAAWSSHFFYILMGFIPEERNIPFYGIYEIDVMEKLCAFNNIEQVEKLSSDDKVILVSILTKETQKDNITSKDLFENQHLFSKLKDKEMSYITYDFIPKVLAMLTSLKDGERPDTHRWGSVIMVMSPEGYKRWQEAIDNEDEFISFRNYSHLRPYMTIEQNKRLDKILATKLAAKQSSSTPDDAFLREQTQRIMTINDQCYYRGCCSGDISALESLRPEPISDAKISVADLIDFATGHQKALIEFKEQAIKKHTALLKNNEEIRGSFSLFQYKYDKSSDIFFQPLIKGIDDSIQELEKIIAIVRERFSTGRTSTIYYTP